MGSRADLKKAKELRPELYQEYRATEKELNHTLQMSGKSLDELTA